MMIEASPVFSATLALFSKDSVAGDFVPELHACLGVDLQVSHPAVGQELVRLDYGSDDLDPMLRFQLALSGLQSLHKLGVRPGQRVRILHDFENARIVLGLVPGQGHSADLHLSVPIVDLDNRDGGAPRRDSQDRGGAVLNLVV